MRAKELEAVLHAAAAARGLAPGAAKPKRGLASLGLAWRRPEPVILRADPRRRVLVLEHCLPFVLPGGRLHRALRSCAAERCPQVQVRTRDGHISLALPVAGDWPEALDALLAAADALAGMLQADWPDYATGVFAPRLE